MVKMAKHPDRGAKQAAPSAFISSSVATHLAAAASHGFYSKIFVCAAIGLSISLFAGCSNSESEAIGADHKRIIGLTPLIDHGEEPWPTHPSEKIANRLLSTLEMQTPGSSTEIKACAARDNPAAAKCHIEEAYDSECGVKGGYWKGFVGKHLFSFQADINGDNIPDYIIRGDYCSGFSHNYTWDVFVLLSHKNKPHDLALAVNANRFDVMPLAKRDGQVIVEGISSYNGESVNIHVLQNGKYIQEACFYRDRSEIDRGRDLRTTNCTSPGS